MECTLLWTSSFSYMFNLYKSTYAHSNEEMKMNYPPPLFRLILIDDLNIINSIYLGR